MGIILCLAYLPFMLFLEAFDYLTETAPRQLARHIRRTFRARRLSRSSKRAAARVSSHYGF